MTTTNTPATWRDYIDQLTPQQVAELEYCEAQQIPPGLYSPETALGVAQRHVLRNEAQQRFAAIPVPADAIDVPSPWADYDESRWWRCYTAHRANLDYPLPEYPNHDGSVVVEVVGHQYSDETVERYIRIDGGGLDQLTAAQAREVAAAVIAAAEVMDRADGTEPPFM